MIIFLELLGIFLVFTAGTCFYSFLNVVIYRFPRKIAILKEQNRCMACGHILTVQDMIPVVSWLILRGRCRYCDTVIPIRYSRTELLGGLTATILILRLGWSFQAGLVFAFLALLTVIGLTAWETKEIPALMLKLIMVLVVLQLLFLEQPPYLTRIIGGLCISLPLFVVKLRIPSAFTMKEIYLMAVCGLFSGWKVMLVSFTFAVLCGGIYALKKLLGDDEQEEENFLYGPFLCIGVYFGQVFGDVLIRGYLSFFGLA
jgi:leader peptidase (prepilin peptidase)/N-methyltransferase